jgi:hypothetical protein
MEFVLKRSNNLFSDMSDLHWSHKLGPEISRFIWSIDPDIFIPTVVPLDTQIAESIVTERFQTAILSSFGGAPCSSQYLESTEYLPTPSR